MDWEIKFIGRQVNADGITYPMSAVVQAENQDKAILALYEWFDHINRPVVAPLHSDYAIRYVLTVREGNERRLAGAAQGRETYATREEAEAMRTAILRTNSPETLRQVYKDPDSLAVRPCKCWAGHFDPVGIYFAG